MRVTESAANAILNIMKKRGLNPKEFVFDISIKKDGAVGIAFVKGRAGVVHQYGELTVTVGESLDMEGVVVDFGEVNERQGIIFLPEKDANGAELLPGM